MPDFYTTLFGRRDVRSEFLATPVASDVLARILMAAHHAPSVGLSQPWNFLIVESESVRAQVFQAFCTANEEAAEMFPEHRRTAYRELKLQGILDAPLNICVTCHRERGGEVVLGRTHQREMDIYSTVCAVQNLWLAARAENIGVGWVSILRSEDLQTILALPESVIPVAYLCLGHVSSFRDEPELQARGWEKRRPVSELVYTDQWGQQNVEHPVYTALQDEDDWLAKQLRANFERADAQTDST